MRRCYSTWRLGRLDRNRAAELLGGVKGLAEVRAAEVLARCLG
jgi:hypothetical protein